MKLNRTLASLLIAGCCLGVGSTAFAATCNATLGPINTSNVPPGTFSGSDCGANANFNGAGTLCGGVSYSNTGTDVWQVQMGAGQNFTFSVTSAAFVPDIALLSTACADNSPCVNNTDYSSGTGTATSTTVSGQPAGTYYLVVTDSTASGAQCGAYNLAITGTLPVKLQNFSVQ
jgi:hypothetical protein